MAAALVAAVMAQLAGAQLVRITSGSMAPTVGVGDWVLVMSAEHPRVGDVIEFKYPSGSTSRAIKRVVATGGTTVELRDGELIVDGRRHPLEGEAVRFDRRTIIVPAGHYYLLGDNHAGSVDSRSFGPIPSSDVVGIVRHTVPDPRLVLTVLLGTLLIASVFSRQTPGMPATAAVDGTPCSRSPDPVPARRLIKPFDNPGAVAVQRHDLPRSSSARLQRGHRPLREHRARARTAGGIDPQPW